MVITACRRATDMLPLALMRESGGQGMGNGQGYGPPFPQLFDRNLLDPTNSAAPASGRPSAAVQVIRWFEINLRPSSAAAAGGATQAGR